MNREFIIDGKLINDDSQAYVIAEIGHNHQGDIEKCKLLFKAAKESGADAVKLQKRDNKNLYTKEMYDSPYVNRNSYGKTYGEHREYLEFDKNQYLELKDYANELEITFFSTPFDFQSADFLEELDLPAYKIASGDLRNIPLMKHVAQFNKPIIISTGGADMEDVIRAYNEITSLNKKFSIMQCTSGYPASYDELNLNVIKTYRESFKNIIIGYSGHDNGIAMPVVAYMLGARIIEKHFTLNRTWKGTDQVFSLSPDGMRKMVRDLKRTRIALGSSSKSVLPIEEMPIHKMGKKLVASRAISKGDVISGEDIMIKSPGDGIPPYDIDKVIGKVTRKDMQEDETFSFELLD